MPPSQVSFQTVRPFRPAAILAFAAFAFPCVPTVFSAALPPVFQGLGVLPGDTFGKPGSLSADGLVVVGRSIQTTSMGIFVAEHPFSWTYSGGMVALSMPHGASGGAVDASATGLLTLGYIDNEPTIWTSPGTFVQPDIAATLPVEPFLVGVSGWSDDGGVISGTVWDAQSSYLGTYRWSLDSSTWIPNFWGKCISADGALIAGSVQHVAARATQAGEVLSLGKLYGDHDSDVLAVSANGRVFVGRSGDFQQTNDPHLACRWRTWVIGIGTLVQLTALETPDPNDTSSTSSARAVSADGTVIGGAMSGAKGAGAMIWDADHGMRLVKPLLENSYNLAAELQNWSLSEVTGVATDDTYLYLAGYGTSPDFQPQPWWARIPKPGPTLRVKLPIPLLVDREPYYIVCDPLGPHGVVRFAVLGIQGFDTQSLVRTSIRFGNATAAMAQRYEFSDVNRDGLMDLMLQFNLRNVYRGMDWRNTKVLRFLGTTTRGVDVLGEILVQNQIVGRVPERAGGEAGE